MDRELGQKRGNGQHDGQHGRYMYEKKGIWLEGSVLTDSSAGQAWGRASEWFAIFG
jgi:hypothetical protein